MNVDADAEQLVEILVWKAVEGIESTGFRVSAVARDKIADAIKDDIMFNRSSQ